MPYRLRLFSGDQLLVTTTHETTEEVGQKAATFPLGELEEARPDGTSAASLTRKVTRIDERGEEHPATQDEENEVFEALTQRFSEIQEAEMPPCQRCGKTRAEHEHGHLSRGSPTGPIYYDCWTDDERDQLDPRLRPS